MQKKRPEGRFSWLITTKSVRVTGVYLCEIGPREGTQTCRNSLRLGELRIGLDTDIRHV